jgi:hypothetical protein
LSYDTMNSKTENSTAPRQPRRLPKGPLIIILLVLASMAWAYWLTRSAPRPPPEFPPLRQLPLESLQQQAPRADPAEAQEREQPSLQAVPRQSD